MIKKVLLIAVIVPTVAFTPFDILDSIADAIRTGNAKEVAKHFDANVEIQILEKESTYSKAQAEMVLRDFFAKNPVQSFELIHRGSTGQGSSYAIGNMKAGELKLRCTYYLKQKGNLPLIQQMQFEKQK